MKTINAARVKIASRKNWAQAVKEQTELGRAYVLVTIISARGSTPRDGGTKMVVTTDTIYDTIGGGHLEHQSIATAQKLLENENQQQHIEHYKLGPSLGQCCGGSTTLLFERFATNHVNIMLFGAGHVGRALVDILGCLPCRLTWVDSRDCQFPAQSSSTVSLVTNDEPMDEVATMPANSYYIVMTHNHQLDYKICQTILKRDDFSYLGLIGSDTKWRRFKQRFEHNGIAKKSVARINCPVGLRQVQGKHPMEVAVSIAGEIIEQYQQEVENLPMQQGLHWKDISQMLDNTISNTPVSS